VQILNPLFDGVAWVIMRIHAVLSVPFGASSGWAWGLSIVILVMLMRLIMVPLFVKQVNSQRKMQSHMPQLQEIRKKFKNDKQKLNEETMKFYKENGINPLGGCLPLIAQLPVFWSLFNVLKAIAGWTGGTPQYGLTIPVVQSARDAHIFGVTLADKFLFIPSGLHETWTSRSIILVSVLVSALTTFLTMRQSAKRGMMNQQVPDPDQPGAAMAASMSKNMMYIAPFFALTGLYWQYGLVIYWVTTNLWTLGQQHFLFRNLPMVGSATVGASAVQAASGNAGAVVKNAPAKNSGSAKTADKVSASGTVSSAAKAKSAAKSGVNSVAKSGANSVAKSGANGVAKSGANASVTGGTAGSAGSAVTGSAGRGLLRFGKSKPEPEADPVVSEAKVVRQQPVRQVRSKRSGNSGKR
jgi:YidC/Oxa1 family membrane protein insertase